MTTPDPLALPNLPRDAEGPVFAEPWQAQTFALAVQLHAGGAFTWAEWAQALSSEIAGDPDDDGSRYYEHWQAALEGLLTRGSMLDAEALSARRRAWEEAYVTTPHGMPVELPAGTSAPSVR